MQNRSCITNGFIVVRFLETITNLFTRIRFTQWTTVDHQRQILFHALAEQRQVIVTIDISATTIHY